MSSEAAFTSCKRLVALIILFAVGFIFFAAYKGQENAESVNPVTIRISSMTIKALRVEVPYRLVLTKLTTQVLFSNTGFDRNVRIEALRTHFDYKNVSISCGRVNNEITSIGGHQEMSLQIKENPKGCKNHKKLFSFLRGQSGKELARDLYQKKIKLNFNVNFVAIYDLRSGKCWRARSIGVCKDLVFKFDRHQREWIFKGDGIKACNIFIAQEDLDKLRS
ncbi:hypothetical protein K2173_016873 [Erythroxylum novogranatense]|uniref:Uncharacterized protein n=1 Tax=Erythroxylum novogranatense TaxID=1862640 RepID=A0AAV8U524_9ROSI|nr:hypothetical protein K2173_016873 [Erythroxylum novogranatense]